jgi:hypothetical protein
MPNTTAVAVTMTLDSSATAAPFLISNCSGVITYADGSTGQWGGWAAEDLGTPEPNGATFTLNVVDTSYPLNLTSVQNWALTFIPRGSTSQDSPFGNNVNTITGMGAANTNGNFALDLGGAKIKNAGDWDWALMVQMQLSSGEIRCFASDPEMEVGA